MFFRGGKGLLHHGLRLYGHEPDPGRKKTDFTAVYAISDSIAIGACKAITEYGMKIPEDYSVAGFDGLDIAHYYNPTLTTIRQPVEEMAEATIKILFDVVSNHADHQKRVFKAELMEGESTRNVK